MMSGWSFGVLFFWDTPSSPSNAHRRLFDLCTIMDTLLKAMDDLHSASLLSGGNLWKGKKLRGLTN